MAWAKFSAAKDSAEFCASWLTILCMQVERAGGGLLLLGPDNKVEYRKVTLGRVVDGLRIVREGLKPGDVIVVNGAQRVHPGVAVAPQRVTMGGDAPAQGVS